MRLVENESVKKIDQSHKVFCEEDYAQELYNIYCDYFNGDDGDVKITSKDLVPGQILKVKITSINEKNIIADTEYGQTVFLDYNKELKFLSKSGIVPQIGNVLEVMVDGISAGSFIASTESAFNIILKNELMEAIKNESSAYEAKIKSINDGGFIVDIQGMDCFLPGSLAAANKISDFESMIGKTVRVMVETYLDNSDMFVVSAKKYIKHILPSKINELDYLVEYSGTVTGVANYGVFIEWDNIFTGLLHSTEIPNDEWKNLKSGESIKFYIKDIKDNNRIILSQNGPNPEYLEYVKFSEKYEDEICEGLIKDIKPFGTFIEINGLVGMMIPSDFKKYKNLSENDHIEVYVKKVDPAAKKIYLRYPDDHI